MRHAMELFQPAFDEERQDDGAQEQQWEAQRHRELDLKEALDECHAKGVSAGSMQTLLWETGARWMPNTNQERKS